MVKQVSSPLSVAHLDSVFGSLADATRRDIVRRVTVAELSVGELARSYDMSLAAVSKHVKILEQARLISKRRQGKEMLVSFMPGAFRDVEEFIDWHRRRMEARFDALEAFLQTNEDQTK